MPMQSTRAARRPIVRRLAAGLTAALLATGLSAGSVSATHTIGTLDCGSAGSFQTEGVELDRYPFGVPVPWSGIFLLEGTTTVFRAFSNSFIGTDKTPAMMSPRPLITCTLTSVGPAFENEWTLVGMLVP